MTPVVHIDRAEGVESPDDDSFSCWITAALDADPSRVAFDHPELSLRIADSDEVASLNSAYRGKHGPTNVLSFPADLPDVVESSLLGDIVICAPLVDAEAQAQGKSTLAHWAHLTVHGVLHLLGHDHLEDDEAELMESLETQALRGLGFTDPYQISSHSPEGGVPAS